MCCGIEPAWPPSVAHSVSSTPRFHSGFYGSVRHRVHLTYFPSLSYYSLSLLNILCLRYTHFIHLFVFLVVSGGKVNLLLVTLSCLKVEIPVGF